MIRLDMPKAPYWLDLPLGVRVQVRPLTTAVMRGAQFAATRAAAEMATARREALEAGADASPWPDLDDASVKDGVVTALLTKALARQAVVGWEGVLTADRSGPAAVTPENVEELMDLWAVAEAFRRDYPAALEALHAEGEA